MKTYLIPFLLLSLFASCNMEPTPDALSITFDPAVLNFEYSAKSDTVQIDMNGEYWEVTSNVTWCTVSKKISMKQKDSLVVTVSSNTGTMARTAILIFNVGNGKLKDTLVVNQNIRTYNYPKYGDSIASNMTGMNSSAMEIAQKIKVGWNAGNTLEATGGETAWGNPMINDGLIKLVKQSGFQAIRLPCSWDQYANQSTAKISESWLNRVKQVVQYCVDNQMYVILNIHWDGGWLENNCTTSKKDENNAKQRAFWQQIATKMRDFDEHLMFASANEPNVTNSAQMSVLMSYHQTFIDAVRSTGGKNAYRVLVVQGPSTDIATTNNLMTQWPTDRVANKLMAEIHYYTPWNFCGMSTDETWGKMSYYWGKDFHSTTDLTRNCTWGEEATVIENFGLMKKKFVDKGIPVVMGEFGAIRRSNLTGDALALHLASRAYFFEYCTKTAISNGLLPFFWDTGELLDRKTNSVLDQQALNGLIQGSTE